MPGLVADAVTIFSRVGHHEAKFVSPSPEPPALPGAAEILGQGGLTGCADIDRPARVMLAVAGGGDPFQDLGQFLAGSELAANDGRLPGGAAITREGNEDDPVLLGGGSHPAPSDRCTRRQTNGLPVGIAANSDEAGGFPMPGQTPAEAVIGRNPQGFPEVSRPGQPSCSASHRSASIAAWQPIPAAVMAWR